MQEIHLQFPNPGHWDQINMTVIYEDVDGYTHTDPYTQADIPDDQVPALAASVTAIASMDEDWQAVQAWARLGKDVLTLAEDGTYKMIDAVSLTVEAVHAETKGRRIFTVSDYPAFVLTDPAAVAFFRYFASSRSINS